MLSQPPSSPQPQNNNHNNNSVRTLYEKYLEWGPSNADAWLAFAELEAALGEHERARALYELAVGQPVLDAPERVWRAYVEFECARRERARARVLYERLLDRTGHVKVWLSFARFELRPLVVGAEEEEQEDEGEEEQGRAGAGRRRQGGAGGSKEAGDEADNDDDDESPTSAAACERRLGRARAVYERGFRALREGQPDAKQEAAMLLEAWRAAELGASAWGRAQADVNAAVAAVDAKRPRRVKRKRAASGGAGQPPEEYWDLAFPGEGEGGAALRLLEAAQRWKRQKQQQQQQQEQDQAAAAAGE
jgi:crooked neck